MYFTLSIKQLYASNKVLKVSLKNRMEASVKFLDFSDEVEGISAFNQLYQDYHQAVYFNILKIVRQQVLAEDLLQDVFIALWENHLKIEKERVAQWLFVVSYNKSITCLKKVRKEILGIQIELRADLELEPVSEEDFEWKLQLVEEAISTLPTQKKMIFSKYRLEGKSLDEIARELNISVNTVKDHLKVAKKLIKIYLAEKGVMISGTEIIILAYLAAFL